MVGQEHHGGGWDRRKLPPSHLPGSREEGEGPEKRRGLGPVLNVKPMCPPDTLRRAFATPLAARTIKGKEPGLPSETCFNKQTDRQNQGKISKL